MNHNGRPLYEFGPFRLDPSEYLLRKHGQPVVLTPKVFQVLRVLVQNAGHLVEKDRLLTEVWADSFVEEGALSRSVSILRKALGERTSGEHYIQTVPTLGYRFVAPVIERFDDSSRSSGLESSTQSAVESRRGVFSRAAGIAGLVLIIGGLAYTAFGRREPVTTAVHPTPSNAVAEHRQVTFAGKEGAPTISADGRRIAYVSDENPERKVMVQELSGGQPLAIFSAPEVGYLRWSPDSSDLLVWARGSGKNGVYKVPLLGGTPVLIKDGQYVACWSPDGSTIAVVSYLGGKVWFLDRFGHEQRAISLPTIPWSIWDIDWSPRNGLLTVVSDDPQGRFTIWTVRPDGRDQTKILSEDREILSARWAPDGAALYYSHRVNQTVSLFRIPVQSAPADSRPAAMSLLTGLESARAFALSADGTRLVYARVPYYANVWMLDAPGTGQERSEWKQLTSGTSLIEGPRISPDGRSILFSIGHEPVANLHTMPVAGGSPKQLTFLDSLNVGGVWSADGKQIAFVSTQGGRPRVWTVGADSGTPRPVSSGDLSSSFDVAWSPGSRILYRRAGNRDFYSLDPETGNERLLAQDSSVGWLSRPAYSRDGQKIAVFWNRRPSRGLWILDTEERSERLLYKSSAPSHIIPIGWTGDGGSVYAVEAQPGKIRGRRETLRDAKILMLPLNGAEVKTVASLPFEEVGDVSMTPDERRFVATVYSSRSDIWIVDNFDVTIEHRTQNKELRTLFLVLFVLRSAF